MNNWNTPLSLKQHQSSYLRAGEFRQMDGKDMIEINQELYRGKEEEEVRALQMLRFGAGRDRRIGSMIFRCFFR